MPKSWPCAYQCENPVSEIGAYVKLTSNKYAHLTCHDQHVSYGARIALMAEQDAQRAEQEARERQERQEREARERQERQEREAREARGREEQVARNRAFAERQAEVAERERTNRIEAQRAMPLPPRVDREEAARRAIAEGKSVTLGQEPERPKSRFELIEMDDELVEEKE